MAIFADNVREDFIELRREGFSDKSSVSSLSRKYGKTRPYIRRILARQQLISSDGDWGQRIIDLILPDNQFGIRRNMLIVAALMLFLFVVRPLKWIDSGQSNAHSAQLKMHSESCRSELRLTEDESISQCKNAAALFGQDISNNITRIQSCIEHHQHMIASCQKSDASEPLP